MYHNNGWFLSEGRTSLGAVLVPAIYPKNGRCTFYVLYHRTCPAKSLVSGQLVELGNISLDDLEQCLKDYIHPAFGPFSYPLRRLFMVEHGVSIAHTSHLSRSHLAKLDSLVKTRFEEVPAL